MGKSMHRPAARLAAIVFILLGLSALTAISAMVLMSRSSDIDRARIAAVAAQHPKFTVEQRLAIAQELRAEKHPQWKSLSPMARLQHAARVAKRILQQMSGSSTTPVIAPFVGNQTIIRNTSGNFMGLQRQSDCSLTRYDGSYSYVNPNASAQLALVTAHYEQTLHSLAGLKTSADVFAGGCKEATLGTGSRRAGFLGTVQNSWFLAGTGYNGSTGNSVYFGLFNPGSTAMQTATLSGNSDASEPGTVSLAFGDLNGDGLADVIGVDETAADIQVYLAQANGTLSAPTTYVLTGALSEGATVADVNGDGKADVVVATRDGGAFPQQEHLCVLTGKGNGQLNAGLCTNVASPATSGFGPAYLGNLIAANLRGGSTMDVVGVNGVVLLNDGSGTFTAGTPVFTPGTSTSNFGPNLAAADFNKDGKPDLAMDDGQAVHIFLGKGDGTFSAGGTYASNIEVGYLNASDLDGDGNTDLYVGLANGGLFSGDQFDANQSYALMGNGNGTFGGAPYLPFVYTGANLVDVTGDGKLDVVGVGSVTSALALTFTTYVGNGAGGFAEKSTLPVASLSFAGAQGNPYTLDNIDSFGLADVTGDGKPDLVFISSGLQVRPTGGLYTAGLVLSVGDGAGNFATPTFIYSGHFVPGNDIDVNPGLSNLRLADVNGDGKADLVFNYIDEDYTVSPNVYYSGVAVQLGNGDGTFQAPKLFVQYSGGLPSQFSYNVAAIHDLNRDGKPDLLIWRQTTVATSTTPALYTLEAALGKGDGTFAAPVSVATNDIPEGSATYGTQYTPLAIADMNGDGVPDIVTLGQSTAGLMQVAIALGNGDGTFKAPAKFNYSGYYELEGLAVGDFNGDGKQDIAISGYFGYSDNGITYGNGDGTLPVDGNGNAQFNELIYLPGGGSAAALDFNGDGKMDFLDGQTLLLRTAATSGGGGGTGAATFALTASSSAGTVSAGQSATSTLTLAPSNGFTGAVALSCSGLPTGASCAFSPASVSLSGTTAVTSTLTIATTMRMMTLSLPAGSRWGTGGAVLAIVLLPMVIRRRHRRSSSQLRSAAVLIGLALLAGCGGGSSSGGNGGGGGSSSGTPAGTYTITVTATGGSVTKTATYTLTVN